MSSDRRWSDADRELVRPHVACGLWWCTGDESCPDCAAAVAAVLDALTERGWRPPPPKPDGIHWRTGTSVGRTIYDPHGHICALMDTPEQASAAVAALNAAADGGTDE